MENASKALIMAGGMLLAILIVSLLIFAWGKFSEYQSSQDELADLQDTAKFNEQFANYDRKDVEGYEILSLVNKVIDYNQRRSNLENAKNDERSSSITIKVKIDRSELNKFTYDSSNPKLFANTDYTQSEVKNVFDDIIKNIQIIETKFGGVDEATKLAKSIGSIYLTQEQLDSNQRLYGKSEDLSWLESRNKFNSIVKNNKISETDMNAIKNKLNNYKDDIYKYYEYVQFKKAVFECTKTEYDDNTSRIKEMDFVFTGEIK